MMKTAQNPAAVQRIDEGRIPSNLVTDVTSSDEPEIDLLMASLRADDADTTTYFAILHGKLSDALGARVVTKRGRGVLRNRGGTNEFAISIGEHEFTAALANGTMACADRHVVKGIALSSTDVELAEWLERLLGALTDEARRSTSTRTALERLLA
jgi:hypothetical protein